MKYKLHKVTNRTQRSYGKYVAKAIHPNTITANEIELEIADNCSAKQSDCQLVLCELADTIKHHLQAGDRVELPFLGTIKLEIDSMAVDTEEEFNVARHVKGLRLHLLPKSSKGKVDLYDDIEITKE